jgi:hypothetical protein
VANIFAPTKIFLESGKLSDAVQYTAVGSIQLSKLKSVAVFRNLIIVLIGIICGGMLLKFQPPPEVHLPREYSDIDVSEMISIDSPADINRAREELTTVLFGDSELLLSMPSGFQRNISDKRYDDISSLNTIDKFTIKMDYGIESHVYHFIPETPNGQVILYHQGHHGDFFLGKDVIHELLDHGYAVVGFSMPLLGPNNQPTVEVERLGRISLKSHDFIKFLTPEAGHNIKYFLEPVIAMVNHIERNLDYSRISMVGISGGGWVTTLAAAVDHRIKKSFPVSGTYPILLRTNNKELDWGDYEQTEPEIYTTTNYLELYILGSYGLNRKQLQIMNKFDPCCLGGVLGDVYRDVVREKVTELGAGEYEFFLDTTHMDHKISAAAMERIFSILDSVDNQQVMQ